MDFTDERDEKMEKDDFEIEVGGRIVRIPSEVIKERMKLLYIDSESEAIKDAKEVIEAYASDLSEEEIRSKNFERDTLKFLDFEIDVYRR